MNINRHLYKFLAFAVTTSIASFSHAHHGSTSQFDQNSSMEVQGVITKMRFVNPHAYVYFDVTDDAGKTLPWRCEMRSGSLLKRTGWTAEMFAEGTPINITGAPAWREPEGCYIQTIQFDNGPVYERNAVIEEDSSKDTQRKVRRANGTPNLGGTWVAQGRGAAPIPGAPAAAPRLANPGDRYAMTDAGAAAVADFVREDNPRFHCQATNIMFDWTFDQHVNQIDQSEDKITLTYGFMDIVRTIHLDMDRHPENLSPSRTGHSIGKWQDDKLTVDTVGFEPGYLTARPGVKHSDQLHVIETFYLVNEGQALVRSYSAEDPLFLSVPVANHDTLKYTHTAFDPYDCEDLTEEIVKGI